MGDDTDGLILQPLRWLPALEMGIAEIDAEHRHLIEGTNRLLRTLAEREPWSDTVALVRSIKSGCFEHFRTEERNLLRDGYPELVSHAREHRRIERDLVGILAAVENAAAQTRAAIETVVYFRSLLLDHLVRSDLGYKSHLQHCRGR